jgi:hypothetical protein
MVEEAQPALTPGEEILDATTGMIKATRMGTDTERNDVVLVTDRRIVVFTKKVGGLRRPGLRVRPPLVGRPAKDDVGRIAQLIREKMALAHRGVQAGGAPSAPADTATEIRTRGTRRRAFTAAEFEAKKKQLLGL